eukprot:Nk52_evm83s208 gene=Nk52_evmTU83s208
MGEEEGEGGAEWEVTLPPSPNWYCAQICDSSWARVSEGRRRRGRRDNGEEEKEEPCCSALGVLIYEKGCRKQEGETRDGDSSSASVFVCAYGSKSSIVLFSYSSGNNNESPFITSSSCSSGPDPVFLTQLTGHKSRVTALSFSSSPPSSSCSSFLASGDVEGGVIIWDVSALVPLVTFNINTCEVSLSRRSPPLRVEQEGKDEEEEGEEPKGAVAAVTGRGEKGRRKGGYGGGIMGARNEIKMIVWEGCCDTEGGDHWGVRDGQKVGRVGGIGVVWRLFVVDGAGGLSGCTVQEEEEKEERGDEVEEREEAKSVVGHGSDKEEDGVVGGETTQGMAGTRKEDVLSSNGSEIENPNRKGPSRIFILKCTPTMCLRKLKEFVTCVEYIPGGGGVDGSGGFVAPDDEKIASYDRGNVVLQNEQLQASQPFAASSNVGGCLAVGCRSGFVYIISASKLTLVHKLRGHDSEVQSIAFNHTLASQREQEARGQGTLRTRNEAFVIGTGSVDKTIKLWSVCEGKLLKSVKLPKASAHLSANHGNGGNVKQRVWIALEWSKASPEMLFSSSHGGELLTWKMDIICSKDSASEDPVANGQSSSENGLAIKNVTSKKFTGSAHNRIVFGLGSSDAKTDSLFSVSMDRTMIFWNVATGKSQVVVPTLGGYPYSLSLPFHEPSKLAIAMGDNSIRIWDISSTLCGASPLNGGNALGKQGQADAGRFYDSQLHWKGLQAKVTSVAYHPTREGVLAVGLDDGHVGLYDVYDNAGSLKVVTTRRRHRGVVYRVCWDKPQLDSQNSLDDHSCSVNIGELFSCGADGIVLSYRNIFGCGALSKSKGISGMGKKKKKDKGHSSSKLTGISEKEAIDMNGSQLHEESEADSDVSSGLTITDINDTVNSVATTGLVSPHHQTIKFPKRTDIAFSPNGKVFAVGNSNGSIEVYNRNFILLLAISSHKKAVTCIEWGLGGVNGGSTRPAGYLLASGSDDNTARVYEMDFAREKLESTAPTQEALLGSLPAAAQPSCTVLKGHTKRVSCVSFSPSESGILASGSYDGTVQVWRWSASGGPVPVANFRGHFGRIFCVQWNISNPFMLISGSDDQSVRIWDYRRTKHSSFASVKEDLNGRKDKIDIPCALNKENGTNLISEACAQTQRSSRKVGGPVSNNRLNDNSQQGESGGTKKRREKKMKTILQIGVGSNESRQRSLEGCLQICRSRKGKEKVGTKEADVPMPASAGLYGKRQDVKIILDSEISYLQRLSNTSNSAGNVDGDKEAANQEFVLYMWQGKGRELLMKAIDSGTVTETMVAMSNSFGKDVWEKASLAYADQIASECRRAYGRERDSGGAVRANDISLQLHSPLVSSPPSPHIAVGYYLSCHCVRNAIKLYLDIGFFREAAALGKVRLCESDPLLVEVHVCWGRHMEDKGLFEQAAKCYVYIAMACERALHNLPKGGKREDLEKMGADAKRKALGCIGRKGDILALKYASEVAAYFYELSPAETSHTNTGIRNSYMAKYAEALVHNRAYEEAIVIYRSLIIQDENNNGPVLLHHTTNGIYSLMVALVNTEEIFLSVVQQELLRFARTWKLTTMSESKISQLITSYGAPNALSPGPSAGDIVSDRVKSLLSLARKGKILKIRKFDFVEHCKHPPLGGEQASEGEICMLCVVCTGLLKELAMHILPKTYDVLGINFYNSPSDFMGKLRDLNQQEEEKYLFDLLQIITHLRILISKFVTLTIVKSQGEEERGDKNAEQDGCNGTSSTVKNDTENNPMIITNLLESLSLPDLPTGSSSPTPLRVPVPGVDIFYITLLQTSLLHLETIIQTHHITRTTSTPRRTSEGEDAIGQAPVVQEAIEALSSSPSEGDATADGSSHNPMELQEAYQVVYQHCVGKLLQRVNE